MNYFKVNIFNISYSCNLQRTANSNLWRNKFLKNSTIASKCCYIAASGLNIAALIQFMIGKPVLGNECLCFGSAFLCLGSVIFNKHKKREDDQNEKNL